MSAATRDMGAWQLYKKYIPRNVVKINEEDEMLIFHQRGTKKKSESPTEIEPIFGITF